MFEGKVCPYRSGCFLILVDLRRSAFTPLRLLPFGSAFALARTGSCANRSL